VRVLDPCHVVKLGLACVDDVRRRAQQEILGHRGRTRDPLYGIRRVLRRRRDRLGVKARARLEAGLIAGDPAGEVALAWTVAQDLMDLYRLDDPDQARARADQLIGDLAARSPSSPGSAGPCTPGAPSCAPTSTTRQ
jgi:transposase